MSEEVKRVEAYLEGFESVTLGGEYIASHGSSEKALSAKDIRAIIEENQRLSRDAELYDELLDKLELQNKRLMAALDPEKTKGKYIGEFKFPVTAWEEDESGIMQEKYLDVTVPWSTIKEIMNAIKRQAGEDQ